MRLPPIKFVRVRALATPWTFGIPAVRGLLERYVSDGKGWADPFAGRNLCAEWSNDMNPMGPAKYHMEAELFVRTVVPNGLTGALFDPPYSKRQISEHYKGMGQHATMEDTNAIFYSRVLNPLAQKVKIGGHAIRFGYNSNGFGRTHGYKLLEILLVNFGSDHYDLIVTLEQRVQERLDEFEALETTPPIDS